MSDFYLLWKGRQSGPFSLEAIRAKLASGDINRMHQVSVGGRWIVLGEYLDQLDGGPLEARRRAEAAQRAAETTQREAQLRREYEAQMAVERAEHQKRLAEAERGTSPAPILNPPVSADPPPSYLPPGYKSVQLPPPASPDYPPPPPGYGPPGDYPPASYPPGNYPPGYADPLASAYPPPARTSGLAIAAFVLSLCNLIPYLDFITWILAIVFGHIALAQIQRDPSLAGRGLALAALIITYTLLVLAVIAVLVITLVYGINLNRVLHP